MIEVVTYGNLDRTGALFEDQFRLRHREFIERQEYDVKVYKGMEFDQYDTPAAAYLVYSLDGRKALGASRLTPTVYGCMLNDLWPELVHEKTLLYKDDIWEGTRFCVDKSLPADLRRKICYELSAAYVEFGLANGVAKIIGMMPTLILRSVFERSGIFLERLGPALDIPNFAKVQAAGIPVNHSQLDNVKLKTGISDVTEFTQWYKKAA